jgi:hypothetical protein
MRVGAVQNYLMSLWVVHNYLMRAGVGIEVGVGIEGIGAEIEGIGAEIEGIGVGIEGIGAKIEDFVIGMGID